MIKRVNGTIRKIILIYIIKRKKGKMLGTNLKPK